MPKGELLRTYIGDPETLAHKESVGWKPFHVEIGVFVTPSGNKNKVVLDDKQEAIKEKREWENEKRKERKEYNRQGRIEGHPCLRN